MFKAELVEYNTDSYHGTLKRTATELTLENCSEETPKNLEDQSCVRFR